MHIEINLLENFLQLFILFQELQNILDESSIRIPRKTGLSISIEPRRILLHRKLIWVAPAEQHINMPLARFLSLIRLVNIPCYILCTASSSFIMCSNLLLLFRSILQQIKINPYLHKVLVIQKLYFTSITRASKFWWQDVRRNQLLLLVLVVRHLHLLLGVFIGDHWLFYHVLKGFHFNQCLIISWNSIFFSH